MKTVMAARRPRIYLAGPDVFLPDARRMGAEKARRAAEAGFQGCFPLDQELNLAGLPNGEQARRISLANEALMRSCDLLIANMTPFRGVSMDPGTAFEIGYMRAHGRPVLGYTNVTPDLKVRAEVWRQRGIPPGDADRTDLEIEDFGLAENLMMEIAIMEAGGAVVREAVPAGEEMTALTGFQRCLEQARRIVAAGN